MIIKELIHLSRKYIVVDLDETFIKGNTFHLWLRFLVSKFLIKRLGFTIKILFYVFLRFIRVIKHEKLKREILKLTILKKNEINLDEFVQKVETLANKDIINKLKNKALNQIWVLATAAPSIYSEVIANRYNFDFCIATRMNIDSEWKENIREEKFRNVKKLMDSLHINSIDELYTDHSDDIPLMKVARETYLVNPSRETLENVDKAGVKYNVL